MEEMLSKRMKSFENVTTTLWDNNEKRSFFPNLRYALTN